MASKAYVASMTVTELKQELKQRGLSTRGSKKNLRDRLERAFDEEELNDSSSEGESDKKLGPAEAGFNFSVPAESFLPPDQIREDSPVLSPEGDKMIISVELSNKETLEVYSPNPPATEREDEGGGEDGPLVVAVSVPADEGVVLEGAGPTNHQPTPPVAEPREEIGKVEREGEAPVVRLANCTQVNNTGEGMQVTVSGTDVDSTGVVGVSGTAVDSTGVVGVSGTDVGVVGVSGTDVDSTGVVGVSGTAVDSTGVVGVREGTSEVQQVVTGEREGAEGEGREDKKEENVVMGETGESAGGEKDEGTNVDIREREESDQKPKEKESAEENMEVDSSEPLQSYVVTEETSTESQPKVEASTDEPRESEEKIEKATDDDQRESEGKVDKDDQRESEGKIEKEPDAEQRESEGKIDKEVVADAVVPGESSTATVKDDDDEWVIIEHPPPPAVDQTSGDAESEEAPAQRGDNETVVPEVSEGVSEEPQVGASEVAQQKETPEEAMEVGSSGVAMEGLPTDHTEMREQQTDEKPTDTSQDIDPKEQESSTVTDSKEPDSSGVTTEPAESETTSVLESTQQSTAEEGRQQVSPEEQPAAIQATHPSPSENSETKSSKLVKPEEEVSEGVSMEVAVLVHAEEDDLSVFSTEAAEAQKIASSREKGRTGVKAPERARDKDRDKHSSARQHRRPSSTSAAAGSPHPPASGKPHVEEGAGGHVSSRSASGAASADPAAAKSSSHSEETKHGEGGGAESQTEPPSKKRRRISAHVSSSPSSEPASIQWGAGGERRRRWGSGKQRSGSSTTNISSDILKDIIPSELEVGEGEGVLVGEGEGVLVGVGEGEGEGDGELGAEGGTVNGGEDNTKNKEQKDVHQLEWEEKLRLKEAKQREAERARQELETRQRIEARVRARLEQADARAREQEKESAQRHSPSPARNPPSHILHIHNLTRPFTLTQLKELLASDGPLLQDGFWTNNVKSHCIVVYGSKDVATTSRQRLHGLKWPSTNPKFLSVDFLSPEEVQKISEGDLVVMAAPPDSATKGGGDGEVQGAGGDSGEVREGVREEGEGEKPERKRRRESSGVEKGGKQENNKKNAKEESTATADVGKDDPAASDSAATAVVPEKASSQATKLLDDLFRKTKTTPSVYWLPLTETEVQQKQLEREEREAEREKRRIERQKAYEEERKREREREELARKERERRIQEERDRRAKERLHRRSRSRGHSRSRSRSRSHDRYRDKDRRRR